MPYPPIHRNRPIMWCTFAIGLAALAGCFSPWGTWFQRLSCLLVAAVAFGVSYLEFRKPRKGKEPKPVRVKGGKRKAA